MRRHRSICKRIILIAMVVSLSGCMRPPQSDDAERLPPQSTASDPRGFDPLELERDRDVVPARYPREGQIGGRKAVTDGGGTDSAATLGSTAPGSPLQPSDSLNHQTFRIQIFTAQTFGEARNASRVAEEVFDQPVYLDYEVPYFKVRVGNFADRFSAESYQQKVNAAGYTNSWVVMVNLGVQQVTPLYGNPQKAAGADSSTSQDSASHEIIKE
jgi:hypothetical protein